MHVCSASQTSVAQTHSAWDASEHGHMLRSCAVAVDTKSHVWSCNQSSVAQRHSARDVLDELIFCALVQWQWGTELHICPRSQTSTALTHSAWDVLNIFLCSSVRSDAARVLTLHVPKCCACSDSTRALILHVLRCCTCSDVSLALEMMVCCRARTAENNAAEFKSTKCSASRVLMMKDVV